MSVHNKLTSFILIFSCIYLHNTSLYSQVTGDLKLGELVEASIRSNIDYFKEGHAKYVFDHKIGNGDHSTHVECEIWWQGNNFAKKVTTNKAHPNYKDKNVSSISLIVKLDDEVHVHTPLVHYVIYSASQYDKKDFESNLHPEFWSLIYHTERLLSHYDFVTPSKRTSSYYTDHKYEMNDSNSIILVSMKNNQGAEAIWTASAKINNLPISVESYNPGKVFSYQIDYEWEPLGTGYYMKSYKKNTSKGVSTLQCVSFSNDPIDKNKISIDFLQVPEGMKIRDHSSGTIVRGVYSTEKSDDIDNVDQLDKNIESIRKSRRKKTIKYKEELH